MELQKGLEEQQHRCGILVLICHRWEFDKRSSNMNFGFSQKQVDLVNSQTTQFFHQFISLLHLIFISFTINCRCAVLFLKLSVTGRVKHWYSWVNLTWRTRSDWSNTTLTARYVTDCSLIRQVQKHRLTDIVFTLASRRMLYCLFGSCLFAEL